MPYFLKPIRTANYIQNYVFSAIIASSVNSGCNMNSLFKLPGSTYWWLKCTMFRDETVRINFAYPNNSWCIFIEGDSTSGLVQSRRILE